MTGFGAPCGACKFLRRKCLKGCVFAPYFCHEEGAMHFAAIHKVFGASNVSKLLTNLPVSDRCQAAVSISYEALSRVQDPIYGCVSHIFALQQEVVNLETQLHFLRTLAAQNTTYSSSNIHGVFPSVNSTTQMQFYPNNLNSQAESSSNGKDHADPTTFVDYHHVGMPGENFAFNSLQDPPTTSNSMHTNRREWGSQDAEDLQSVVAFPYL